MYSNTAGGIIHSNHVNFFPNSPLGFQLKHTIISLPSKTKTFNILEYTSINSHLYAVQSKAMDPFKDP